MKIELSNHDAVIIASFLMEFKDDIRNIKECAALREAINNYYEQLVDNLPMGGMEDAHMQIEINIALDRSPERPKH